MVHILLKPALENFEHYFASLWDQCNCTILWAFFEISLLWDWKENWCFPVLWPLLSFPNLLAYWVQHVHSIMFSVQFSHSVMSDSLQSHESQHARLPCPSQTLGVYSDSCLSSWWCHPAISSSVVPFSSCPQSLPAAGSFPTSQLFAWGGQSIGVSASASVLPKNIQDWFLLG